MRNHRVRVHRSEEALPREGQLASVMAQVAVDPVDVSHEIAEMIINRVIDNAACRGGVTGSSAPSAAREQAARAPAESGSVRCRVFGLDADAPVSPEWAAFANGVAVRELDFHDTFLAADYSHPGDNIPPIVAVAQHVGADGRSVVRGIATGYEMQIDLVRAISLHKHKIDHIAHLGPSAAAGIGTLLDLPAEASSGDRSGAAHHHGHPAVSQGRDLVVEGLRSGIRGQNRRRGGRPGDAGPDQPVADLRGRGRRHRLAARRTGSQLRRAAAGAR